MSTAEPITITRPALRQLVREAAMTVETPEPAELIAATLAAIPAGMEGEYLAEAISVLAPSFAADVRRSAVKAVTRQPRNAKRDLIRGEWDLFCSRSIPTEDGHMFIGNATALDLRHASEIRMNIARATANEARVYAAMADILEASGKATVAELDPSAFAGVRASLEAP